MWTHSGGAQYDTSVPLLTPIRLPICFYLDHFLPTALSASSWSNLRLSIFLRLVIGGEYLAGGESG